MILLEQILLVIVVGTALGILLMCFVGLVEEGIDRVVDSRWRRKHYGRR